MNSCSLFFLNLINHQSSLYLSIDQRFADAWFINWSTMSNLGLLTQDTNAGDKDEYDNAANNAKDDKMSPASSLCVGWNEHCRSIGSYWGLGSRCHQEQIDAV